MADEQFEGELNQNPDEGTKPTEGTPGDETGSERADLLAALGNLGVQTPEQLQGMATASQQVGRAWNEVGELRKEVERLKTQERIEPPGVDNFGAFGEPEGIDFGLIIEQRLEAHDKKKADMQQQAYGNYMREMNAIASDPEYGVVKGAFERYLATPAAQFQIQTGQTSIKDVYNKVARTYLRELAMRSKNLIEGYVEGQTKPPHIEAGDTRGIPSPERSEERGQKLQKTSELLKSGALDSEAALTATIEEVMKDL